MRAAASLGSEQFHVRLTSPKPCRGPQLPQGRCCTVRAPSSLRGRNRQREKSPPPPWCCVWASLASKLLPPFRSAVLKKSSPPLPPPPTTCPTPHPMPPFQSLQRHPADPIRLFYHWCNRRRPRLHVHRTSKHVRPAEQCSPAAAAARQKCMYCAKRCFAAFPSTARCAPA